MVRPGKKKRKQLQATGLTAAERLQTFRWVDSPREWTSTQVQLATYETMRMFGRVPGFFHTYSRGNPL